MSSPQPNHKTLTSLALPKLAPRKYSREDQFTLRIPSETGTTKLLNTSNLDSSRSQIVPDRSPSRRTANRSSAGSSPRPQETGFKTSRSSEALSEDLTLLLLNLYVAYVDNRAEKLNYRGFVELLTNLKIVDKNKENESSYLKIFREYASKSGNEYLVFHTEFPYLLKQIKALNSTRVEVQSPKMFNNILKSLLKNKFRHIQSLLGESSEFLIDTIIYNTDFIPYEEEFSVFFSCISKESRPKFSNWSISHTPKLYSPLIKFYQAAGVIPNMLSKKELMLVINSVVSYLQKLKDSNAKTQDNLGFLKGPSREPPKSSVAYLNMFRKGSIHPDSLSEQHVFKYLFIVTFEMVNQTDRLILFIMLFGQANSLQTTCST